MEAGDLPIPYNAAKEDLMARMPWDLIGKAHDVGLRQLAVPAEYGGGGYCRTGGWVTLTALAETAGYHNYVFARVSPCHGIIVCACTTRLRTYKISSLPTS